MCHARRDLFYLIDKKNKSSPVKSALPIVTTGAIATGMEIRSMDFQKDKRFSTFGTYGGFFPLMCLAWKGMRHVFSVNAYKEDLNKEIPRAEKEISGLRCSHNLLRQNPVDLLAVDSSNCPIIKDPHRMEHWERMIAKTLPVNRPKIVFESWAARTGTWEYGPTGKSSRVRWENLGYQTRIQRVDAQNIGGAIVQPRLLVVRIQKSMEWKWRKVIDNPQKRAMSNLLTPPGLLPLRQRQYYQKVEGRVAESNFDPMPSTPGRWIRTEKGIRRLLPEEVGRGIGIPKEWSINPALLTCRHLAESTSVYHWEYLAQCLDVSFNLSADTDKVPRMDEEDNYQPPVRVEEDSDVKWRPPDLSKGSDWYKARVARLKATALRYPNYHQIVKDGLEDLERHRTNYDTEGPNPTTLQLLWWEFPVEHQEDVRLGASMNFMQIPTPGLTDNSDMTDEQLVVAGEFVDELIGLGVLQSPPEDRATLLNAPLFVIPKAGQPGQWRCIADMLRGGQNTCIGIDPTILPRANDILDGMYHGGYSAVVDMSKYFYQFRTRMEERKWLGTIHPISGHMYEYHGLPMGSGNSPAIACRIGQGFLRMLRDRYKIFQGEGKANCYWTAFTDLGYDPEKGYGFTMENSEGLVAKVWGFVDDFLIHGPTKEITSQALHAFLDAACTVGFLCHPKKCTPPGQSVKYIGFIFDTTQTPTLRIPTEKRERALVITQHLLDSPPTQQFSRLGLAVAAGILQSLVDATPSFVGSTYLRKFHTLVHPSDSGTGIRPYLTYSHLPPQVRSELRWWNRYLKRDQGRVAYTRHATTLIPTWGDGSGTGTGGTLAVPNQPLQMWQGQWTPTVFQFSSNTKELATLLLTMQHLQKESRRAVRGTTIFYFTDNSTTYYVAQAGTSRAPHLHHLIEQIRLIELELECRLQVVHVPGVVMIQQGTDSLSRGVWCSPFHEQVDQRALTAAVFAPLQPDFGLVEYLIIQHQLSKHWTLCDWRGPWSDFDIFDRLTVWFPPPELARPLLIHVLTLWSEKPWTTEALFIIPRVLAGFWQGLSRHLRELCVIKPHTYPLYRPPSLPIPIVVLHLSPHVRQLPTRDRLDRAPMPRWGRPHQEEAEAMRGMSPMHPPG